MGALDELKQVYRRRDQRARAWKAAGGKVVGHFGGGTPEALIAAAGLMPYQIAGDPTAGSTAIERHLLPVFNKAQSSRGLLELEMVASMLEQLFGGGLDFLDYLVIPNSRKEIAQIHTHLRDARIADPSLALPQVHFLDSAASRTYAASAFDRRKILQFKVVLEGWVGAPINPDALEEALVADVENRLLLAAFGVRRREKPARILGTTALAVHGASRFMPKDEHSQLLATALHEINSLPEREGVRLFVAGSPLDHAGLYQMIESLPAVVVGEDYAWGEALAEPLLSNDPDPIEAIAEHYHRIAPAMTSPIEADARRCAERALRCGAEAAVVWVSRHDDLQLFTAPDQIAALEAAGVPCLYLSEQPYRVDPASGIGDQIAAFLASRPERRS